MYLVDPGKIFFHKQQVGKHLSKEVWLQGYVKPGINVFHKYLEFCRVILFALQNSM